MYILETNEGPIRYTLSELYADNPHTSFPVLIPDKTLAEYNVFRVEPLPFPAYDELTEIVEPGEYVKNNEGFYNLTWFIKPKYVEYMDENGILHTVEEQIQNALIEQQNIKKQSNKAQAERLLQETDYLENPSVSDNTKAVYLSNLNEVVDYRVALRLIATNPPVVVAEWPVKPENIWTTN